MAKKKSLSSRRILSKQPSSEGNSSKVVDLAGYIVSSKIFDWIITGVILLQAFALVLEATPSYAHMMSDKASFRCVLTTGN
jgi:hypothetical protein